MANDAPRPDSARFLEIGAQLLIVAVALFGLTLTPPAQGRMLLVPIAPGSAARLPALALRGDTLLIGTGRVPGSLIVSGRLSTLVWPMLAHGILPLASLAGGCTGGQA